MLTHWEIGFLFLGVATATDSVVAGVACFVLAGWHFVIAAGIA